MRQRCHRNDEDQPPSRLEPSVAVIEKDEFQALIAVLAHFNVIWWVEIQEGAAACGHMRFERAALGCCNPVRGGGGGTISVQFDTSQVRREILRDFQERRPIADARIYGKKQAGQVVAAACYVLLQWVRGNARVSGAPRCAWSKLLSVRLSRDNEPAETNYGRTEILLRIYLLISVIEVRIA